MAPFFSQMAFISAVLGGFSFVFLGALLTIDSSKRLWEWNMAATALAAIAFIISALGATFTAAAASVSEDGVLPEKLAVLARPISLWFLLGIAMLFVSLGLSGWVRSRSTGIITTCVAIVGAIGAAFMMAPFID